MLGQFHRDSNQRYIQHPNNIDNFMFGHRQAPVPKRSLPSQIQRLSPANLLNHQQISKGISGFSGILDNVQQALRIVETTAPLIKEYGPMVKNLPAMYRMMKAFKDINDEPEDTKEIEQKSNEKNSSKEHLSVEVKKEKHDQPEKRERTGVSTPKLYI